jgi:luciferase family oxidoreductase group 1
LRRTLLSNPEEFPRDVVEVMTFFRAAEPGQPVRAVPGAGLKVPIWILGSSTFGAHVAAALGLPFAFASHFAPAQMMEAITVYRQRFEPSEQHERPYVMLGANIVAADSDAEARFLSSSGRQSFASLRQGHPIELPPPSREWERDTAGSQQLNGARVSFVGSLATITSQIHDFVAMTGADELIVVSHIYDHAARLRSYELAIRVNEATTS